METGIFGLYYGKTDAAVIAQFSNNDRVNAILIFNEFAGKID